MERLVFKEILEKLDQMVKLEQLVQLDQPVFKVILDLPE
jgi:hypothetical protein